MRPYEREGGKSGGSPPPLSDCARSVFLIPDFFFYGRVEIYGKVSPGIRDGAVLDGGVKEPETNDVQEW